MPLTLFAAININLKIRKTTASARFGHKLPSIWLKLPKMPREQETNSVPGMNTESRDNVCLPVSAKGESRQGNPQLLKFALTYGIFEEIRQNCKKDN